MAKTTKIQEIVKSAKDSDKLVAAILAAACKYDKVSDDDIPGCLIRTYELILFQMKKRQDKE